MKGLRLRLQFVGQTVWWTLGGLSISICVVPLALGTTDTLPSSMPDLQSIVHAHGAKLIEVDSDKGAIDLFVSSIGPSLNLGDVARTLTAKSISPKLSKDLLLPEITQVAHTLIGDLAAWHLATLVQQAVKDKRLPGVPEELLGSSTRREWLALQGQTSWQKSMNDLAQTMQSPENSSTNRDDTATLAVITLSDQSSRLAVEALQAAYHNWDRLRGWKDQVRLLRGQVRLCGTWQWVIHNHQRHHQEQKLSLLFPPPGADHASLPGLVETIVLGDNVYLRWEIEGRVQEDSLQFVKDGQRLEGTFVNSQGGWGSISGKRTASCKE